jgi:hypothetical protein
MFGNVWSGVAAIGYTFSKQDYTKPMDYYNDSKRAAVPERVVKDKDDPRPGNSNILLGSIRDTLAFREVSENYATVKHHSAARHDRGRGEQNEG